MIPNLRIVELATEVGFDACGVSVVSELVEEKERLADWISNGHHAEMAYMAKNFEMRLNPALIVPNAKSVISVLLSYKREDLSIIKNPPKISRYALGPDYHLVIKTMLFDLLSRIREEFGSVNGRAFVDSAPVLERAWAVKSGLGWIGKSSNLIHPALGSYVFIGELIVDVEIEPTNNEIPNRCGNCTRCVDACPTGAIVKPLVIDASKCISYINIEKKTPLTEQEFSMLNNWCFGCDICQEACPWNKKAAIKNHPQLQAEKLNELLPEQLVGMSETEFGELFAETPLMRAGYEKVMLAVKSIHQQK
ncbi:MAG TPA: tRNA epoxyqueuosine(34) reductase QueG [Tenuifilaceae bacterium]|nr:tRNA epoxyqueuosine(34) reductase QueG [Tenuifilaceae bacterium]HPI44100.1 tRNA epoxyqueuosine(34) reductase QueG [Tenuifilaceae bacterium]HPN20479.1 tRNA epoxyqueuosine(34) reductase QueG [Tenuifilaceae bacterium]HPV56154.1 tRNA epoxyqueuosine(34) reductase QueG [Tenuifilaceae bacterium]